MGTSLVPPARTPRRALPGRHAVLSSSTAAFSVAHFRLLNTLPTATCGPRSDGPWRSRGWRSVAMPRGPSSRGTAPAPKSRTTWPCGRAPRRRADRWDGAPAPLPSAAAGSWCRRRARTLRRYWRGRSGRTWTFVFLDHPFINPLALPLDCRRTVAELVGTLRERDRARRRCGRAHGTRGRPCYVVRDPR
jgi:hypothetical protein